MPTFQALESVLVSFFCLDQFAFRDVVEENFQLFPVC